MNLFKRKIKTAVSGFSGKITTPKKSDNYKIVNEWLEFYQTNRKPALKTIIDNFTSIEDLAYARELDLIDAHLVSQVEARINRATSPRTVVYNSYSGDIVEYDDTGEDELTNFIYDMFGGMENWEEDKIQIADCFKFGFSVMQVYWKEVNGQWLPINICHEYQEHFDFNDGKDDYFTYQNAPYNSLLISPQGEYNFRPVKSEVPFLVTTFDKSYEDRRGIGLYKKTFFASYCKFLMIKFLLQYAQRRGDGTWILSQIDPEIQATKPDGSAYSLTELMNILENIEVAGRSVLPANFKLEPITFDDESGTEMFLQAIRFFQNEQSKIVNGQSATSDIQDTGSRAAIETFSSITEINTKNDIDLIYKEINPKIVKPALILNFGESRALEWLKSHYVSGEKPEKDRKLTAEIKKIEAETNKILIDSGELTVEEIREKRGL